MFQGGTTILLVGATIFRAKSSRHTQLGLKKRHNQRSPTSIASPVQLLL